MSSSPLGARRTSRALLSLLGGAVLFGCEGQISDVAQSPTDMPPRRDPAECAQTAPERVFPRLNRRQFRNSAEALFPARVTSETYPEATGAALTDPEAGPLLSATMEVAEQAAADPLALMGCVDASDTHGCADAYLQTQLPRVFRHPVDDAVRARYLALFDELNARLDLEAATTSLVSAMLMSPEFLYLEEEHGGDGSVNAFELATRLSFFLWVETPDDTLLEAAANGDLETDAGLRAQAERLLDDPRAERGVRAFVEGWLDVERITLASDVEATDRESLAESMRESLLRGVMGTMRDGTFADLYTSQSLYVDGLLAEHLGMAAPTDWTQKTDGDLRGILTHPAMMASRGRSDETGRVIHRGLFVFRALLCTEFPEPPAGATESAVLRTSEECAGCHARIDPIGFAFEGFDSGGRAQADALARPGEVLGTDIPGPFAGVGQLGERIASSDSARRCFAGALGRHALGRVLDRAEECALADVVDDGPDISLRELELRLVTSELFRRRATDAPWTGETP